MLTFTPSQIEHSIVIEAARFKGKEKGFVYQEEQRYPYHARGLALAVMGVRNMTNIDGQFAQFADIRIRVLSETDKEAFSPALGDEKLFDLLWLANENPRTLFNDCKEYLEKLGQNLTVKAAA
ncbi:hypothetical protein J2857_006130 [Neorhizobium galegae]|uniref:hypothetical protein n=1 Tax=Neorhizobium galegae TaxID=399 RepID=UPI001AE6CEED|nr:hypothetical protein [Neorhizobium galegae]MBP2563331.1 hypothetical protein [Neorhizobium galegae]